MSHVVQSAYQWVTRVIQSSYSGSTHAYVSPEDNEEDDTDEYEWTSTVVYGTPLKETKCLFVPEIADPESLYHYTDNQLNTIYHSADEYRNAIDKYGLVYKSQKFPNADTPQKLLEYASDWIKNNYHGGITNFTINALDLHLIDPTIDGYLVGQRVPVIYIDPALHQEASQTLTVITAEYDLNNPEKNSFKIGIPDVTLNKVYGETSKSGGGGGGGGKSSDETDEETNTEVENLADDVEADKSKMLELIWGMVYKGAKNGDLNVDFGDLIPAGVKDPTGDFTYGLSPDVLNTSSLRSVQGNINNITSQYIKSSGGVDAETLSANKGNVSVVNSETVTAKTKVKGKDVEATDSLIVGGVDIVTLINNKISEMDYVDVVIDGIRYRLKGRRLY